MAVSSLTWRNTLLVAAGVVLLAAVARMPFWLSYTHAYGNGDAAIWQVWSKAIHDHGFINVLRTADSNNVGYHYVLWPTSVIYARFNADYELWTPLLRILIKVPPFVCDLGLAALIFATARMLAPPGLDPARRNVAAAGCALAFALAPAAIYDSMWWSQTDSIIALCSLGAIVLLARGQVALAFAVWTLGFLAKPQPVVILPALVAFAYWRFGAAGVLRGAAGGGAMFAAAVAPFVLHGDTRLLIETYQRMFEQGPIDLAQGAWNGWSIADARGDPRPGDALFEVGGVAITYAGLSLALCAGAAAIVLAWLRSRLDLEGLLLACATLVFAFYILPTSTHERYVYPAFALTAPVLVRQRWLIAPYAALSVTFILNLLAINPPNASEFWQWHGTAFAQAIAGFHTAVFAATMALMAVLAVRALVRVPERVPVPAWLARGDPAIPASAPATEDGQGTPEAAIAEIAR